MFNSLALVVKNCERNINNKKIKYCWAECIWQCVSLSVAWTCWGLVVSGQSDVVPVWVVSSRLDVKRTSPLTAGTSRSLLFVQEVTTETDDIILFSFQCRTWLGLYCLSTCSSHDAFASVMGCLFLCHGHSVRGRHTGEKHKTVLQSGCAICFSWLQYCFCYYQRSSRQFKRPVLFYSPTVCESGMPDDLSDGHVPHCVQEGLSQRTAALVSLHGLLFSRSPPRNRGERHVRGRQSTQSHSCSMYFIFTAKCPLVLVGWLVFPSTLWPLRLQWQQSSPSVGVSIHSNWMDIWLVAFSGFFFVFFSFFLQNQLGVQA